MTDPTPRLALNRPTVNGDDGVWAPQLNQNFDILDAQVMRQSDADALYLTPAVGDARYLTPAAGDVRYLTPAAGDAKYLTPAAGDARYLTPAAGDAKYLADAPNDGTAYLRLSAAWVHGVPQMHASTDVRVVENQTGSKAPVLAGFVTPASAAVDYFQIQPRRLATTDGAGNNTDGAMVRVTGPTYTQPSEIQLFSGTNANNFAMSWRFTMAGNLVMPSFSSLLWGTGNSASIQRTGAGNWILNGNSTGRIYFDNTDGAWRWQHTVNTSWDTTDFVLAATGLLTVRGGINAGGAISAASLAAPSIAVNGGGSIGNIEIGGTGGGLIDLKTPFSDDFDLRIGSITGGPPIVQSTGELNIIAVGKVNITGIPLHVATGYISTPQLRGGPGGAGTLNNWGDDGNTICFRWDGVSLSYRVSEIGIANICSQENAKLLNYVGGTGAPTGVTLNGYGLDGTLFGIYVDGVSDARIKENVAPTEVDALAVLNSVPVRSFDVAALAAAWIGSTGKSEAERADAMANAQPVHVPIGFVAQELQAHVPEAVTVQNNPNASPDSPLPADLHTIAQQQFVPYLVRAVQQLSARVAELEGARR